MGARVVPCIFFFVLPAGYIQSRARYLKEEVWKQHWDTSCCYFSSKPRYISFPEGSSENHETPTSLQAPETPCSCSFSKHSQCIHALVAQVSPCSAPEGWEMWCQALSLGQQRREAVEPEGSTPPSPHRATMCSSGFGVPSPQLPEACSPEMLWHIYSLWLHIPSLQPMLMLTLLCTQPAASTGCWNSPLPQPFFSVCQVFTPITKLLFLVGSRLLDLLPSSA